MTTTHEPSGWRIVDPTNHTWGTDLDSNQASSETGGNAIEFLATSPAGTFVELESDVAFVVEPSAFYTLTARINSSANAGGDTIRIVLDLYDATDTFIATLTSFSGLSVGTGAYETIGASFNLPVASPRFARVRFGRTASSAFTVLFDRIEILGPIRHQIYSQGANTALVAGVWTPLNLFGASGLGFSLGATGIINVEEPSIYALDASMIVINPGIKHFVSVRLTITPRGGVGLVIDGSRISGPQASGPGFAPIAVVSTTRNISKDNSTVLIEGFCDIAATVSDLQISLTKFK